MTFTSVDANIFAEANLEIANENLNWGFGWENFAFNFILMCKLEFLISASIWLL